MQSDRAILRETPGLFGLYSLVARWGRTRYEQHPKQIVFHRAAWYPKTSATCSDILAAVRVHLLGTQGIVQLRRHMTLREYRVTCSRAWWGRARCPPKSRDGDCVVCLLWSKPCMEC
jgi:hypothetical protein